MNPDSRHAPAGASPSPANGVSSQPLFTAPSKEGSAPAGDISSGLGPVAAGSPSVAPQKRSRRLYQQTALVACRQTRQMILYWTRRGRKSTTLGDIAFDEMSTGPRRTVIAASASLLLGSELVSMTLSSVEQAQIVAQEASAIRSVFEENAAARQLGMQVANAETGKEYRSLTPEDFAELYKSSKMEMRLYFDRTAFSRLRIIAPNPATARGWGGTVLRDEAGYTQAALEKDLRIATKPIFDTDPSFKLIYASNLSKDDRHPFFEDTMPPADVELPVSPAGNLYRGQTGMIVHRVTLADAYAAGHVLYDDRGTPLTYLQFIGDPSNKIGAEINYTLEHKAGGTAAVDLIALLTAQRRGSEQCALFFIDGEMDLKAAIQWLSAKLGDGPVGLGFDVATTERATSNPSSLTVTESRGNEYIQRAVLVWKERKPQVARERLTDVIQAIRQRPAGGGARRLCIDATNERLFAEETRDLFRGIIPVELVVSSNGVSPAGYVESTNYKTWLGDLYSGAINDNRYLLAPHAYLKNDHRIVVKDRGLYQCDADPTTGAHGDTFDSGKLAQHALTSAGVGFTAEVI